MSACVSVCVHGFGHIRYLSYLRLFLQFYYNLSFDYFIYLILWLILINSIILVRMQPQPRVEAWIKKQEDLFKRIGKPEDKTMLIGDSIVNNFFRYANCSVFVEEFGSSYVNYGVGGDKIRHVLWRINFHKYPPQFCETAIVQVGTNDVTSRCKNSDEIANGIMQVDTTLLKNKSDITIILTGLFPGQGKPINLIRTINYLLEKYSRKIKQVYYLKPVFKDWKNPDLTLNRELYFRDLLHFTKAGYILFAKYIREISESSKTPIPRPVKYEPPPWGPDEVGIGEPISFCMTDGDPAAAARGPWYEKIVKPEERGILNFNAHTYGKYRRPLAAASVASCISEDMGLPGSVVIGLSGATVLHS